MSFLVCFLAGGFSALAMVPWSFVPALFAGLSFLYIYVARSSRPLAAFALGWLFGFGYFLVGLYWVGNALLVEGNPYAWAYPLAVCGLPCLLAFFPAFACLLSKKFADLKTVSGFLAFSAFAGFFAWAQSNVFTGFPWNLYGHAWSKILPMLQILSIADVYWLTFLTVLWAAAPGFLYISGTNKKNKKLLTLFLSLIFVFCLSFGYWRLQQSQPPDRNDIRIRIVQADIPQSEKWDRNKVWGHFMRHIEMSQADNSGSTVPIYIIWSETALSQWLLDTPEARALIRDTLSLYPGPAYILTGLLRHAPDTDSFFNSLVMINKDGNVSNIYDKHHLVPFGEYIPFQKFIPLEPVAQFKGFSGGGHAVTMATPEGIKYSPAVCYEIIFSGRVAKSENRPNFILNVTNDSWYGESAGPWQHLYQAVYRAIEEGIPVVRVADTGISGVIAADGHIVNKSGLFVEYEKTLALPGEYMVFRRNHILNTGVFVGMLVSFIYFGWVNKKKIRKT